MLPGETSRSPDTSSMGRWTKLKRITALHHRSSENVIAGGEVRRGEESTVEKRLGEVRNTQIDGGKAK